MKKTLIFAISLLLCVAICTGCDAPALPVTIPTLETEESISKPEINNNGGTDKEENNENNGKTSASTSAETTVETVHYHQFGQWTIIYYPSCTQYGIQERECSCGDTETSEIETLEHDYSNEQIITDPTCTASGIKRLTCSNCTAYIDEPIELETLSPAEIYSQALSYVGEIIVYDKGGNELGLATGFVYSNDGKVITNYHVIEGAYSAKITINEKTYTISKVLAYDENIDLAVLKINATFDTFATVCSQPIAVGSSVYAIGSSRGMTDTFSQGIITYYNRIVDGVSHIQHDASITHGNSGGPLFNEYGEVIGINTWGISDSQNLNFAVFTSEISNLKFGTPITMAEFYESNFDPYKLLKEWVSDNYNNQGDNWIAFDYHNSNESYCVSSITYYNSDWLAITTYMVFDDGATSFTCVELSENPAKCWYQAEYTDGNYSYKTNKVSGYINASKFTPNSSLTYSSYEGNYWSESAIMNVHQKAIVYSVTWFDLILENYDIGLSIEDFGFTAFN